MRHRRSAFVGFLLGALWLSHAVLPPGEANDDDEQVLFNFEGESAVEDWAPMKLPEVETEQPAPTIEIVPRPEANDGQTGRCLKLTFAGGDWPTVGTTNIPV